MEDDRDEAAAEIERLRARVGFLEYKCRCADDDRAEDKAEIERLRAALEAVDSEIALTGHLKELVDCALAQKDAAND